jgi:hypothetical protein
MKRKYARISLLGGLGNQLFQLAAVMSVDSESRQLDASFSSVRRTGDLEDIFYFTLPQGVNRIAPMERYFLLQKGFNFILRFCLSEKGGWLKSLLSLNLNIFSNLLLRERFSLQVGENLGYVLIDQAKDKNLHLHGYFQSYKYIQSDHVFKQLMQIELVSDNEELQKYRKISETLRPLVVHIRRGDYKTESNFGLLSARYYENAIDLIWDPQLFEEIWLFSDEPKLAIELIPDRYRDYVRIIPDLDGIAASTLEIMRLGAGYVIANSSFSWWGAALSKSPNVRVVAPSKWFKAMNDPLDLIPPNWTKIPSDFV